MLTDFFRSLSYKVELARACDEGHNGTVSYFDNRCAAVEEICHHFNLTYAPDSMDPDTNLTQCNNGTHDVPVDMVREWNATVDV